MTNQLIANSPAFRSIEARVAYLDRQCSQRQLSVQENSELKRERAKLASAIVRAVAALPQDDQAREDAIAMLRNSGSLT